MGEPRGSMSETVLDETLADVLRDVLTSMDHPVVVTSSIGTLEDLVSVLEDGTGTSVRLLATDSVRKEVMDDFVVASAVSDLVATDRIEFRTTDATTNQLVVGSESVVALVGAGDRVAGLGTDDRTFVRSANDHYGAIWDEAEPVTLHTPGISRVRETLADELGSAVRADFDAMLSALDTAKGNGEGLDEVTISLLVAANNEDLFYDISSWGEDVGLASEATFSRTKTRLEEMGLLETEKVPIDVGRPRQRLLLGDERLQGADPADIATTATDIIATGS